MAANLSGGISQEALPVGDGIRSGKFIGSNLGAGINGAYAPFISRFDVGRTSKACGAAGRT